MFHKVVMAAAAVIILAGLLSISVAADTHGLPPSPKEPLDCGVWAYNPVRSGSNVIGKGEISCATAHPWLRVVTELQDWTGRYNIKDKYCYGASYCSTTATLSYSPGRQWMTMVSGYMNGWQAYYQTDWVSIP